MRTQRLQTRLLAGLAFAASHLPAAAPPQMQSTSSIAPALLVALVSAGPASAAAPGAEIAVRGRIVDASRFPVAGATVALRRTPTEEGVAADPTRREPPVVTTKSDAKGEFVVRVPEAGFWHAEIGGNGFVPVRLGLEPVFDDRTLREPIELRRDLGCRARVVDDRGKPIADAAVAASAAPEVQMRLFGASATRPALPAGHTDASGEWRFACAATGRVAAWAVGFAPRQGVYGAASKTLALERGTAVTLRAVDAQKKPLAGAWATLAESGLVVATSDARGLMKVQVREPLELVFFGSKGEAARLNLSTAKLQTAPGTARQSTTVPRDIVLAASNSTAITGVVTDARTRRPIAGAWVWLSGRTLRATRTRGDGQYSLATGQGSRIVNAQASGYLASGLQVSAGSDGSLALEPEKRLNGVVTGEEGRPLAGVEFSFNPASGRPRGPGQMARAEPSDERGRFTVRDLQEGQAYRVRASKSGHGSQEIDLPAEAADPWRVTLERGATVKALILDESARPIAGARVTWTKAPPRTFLGRRFFFGPERGEHATSQTDGRVEARGFATGSYSFTVAASGYGKQTLPPVDVAPGPAVELGEIVLTAETLLSGVVVDRQGGPIPDVQILAVGNPEFAAFAGMREGDLLATTDGEGKFTIHDRRRGERLALSFAAEGLATKVLPNVEVGATEPLRVVLEPTLEVAGRVLDEDRRPVANAELNVTRRSEGRFFAGFMDAVSDADGAFRLRDVQPGLSVLEAEAEGFEPTKLAGLELVAGQNLEGIEVTLHRGASLTGQVLDARNEPLRGARVMALSEMEPRAMTSTDAAGQFRLAGLPTGNLLVVAQDSTGEREARATTKIETGENTITLRFASGVAVSGRVQDEAGQPVPEATVLLNALTGEQGFTRITSRSDGTFSADSVAPGTYRIMIWKDGFQRLELPNPLTVATTPIAGLEITLLRGGAIEGRIQGLAEQDLARVEISASSAGRRSATGTVRPGGTYRMDGLEPGDYEVQAREPGGSQARARAKVEAGQTANADLAFGEDGAALSGRVVRYGEPLAGAVVQLEGIEASFGGRQYADPAGRFRFAGLTPGRYTIEARGLSATHETRREITLPAEGLEVEIVVGGAFVAGRVAAAAGGAPLPGAEIRLEATGAEVRPELRLWRSPDGTTDSRGVFVFDGVPPGSWRLAARKDGYVARELALELEDGERADSIELRLEAATTLVVELRTSAGERPNRVFYSTIGADGSETHTGFALPDTEGQLRIESLPLGPVTVLLRAFGFAVVELPAVVPSSPLRVMVAPEARVDLSIPTLAGSGRVLFTLERAGGGVFREPANPRGEFFAVNGTAVVAGLPAGDWTVVVKATEGGASRTSFSVAAGERKPVVVAARR